MAVRQARMPMAQMLAARHMKLRYKILHLSCWHGSSCLRQLRLCPLCKPAACTQVHRQVQDNK